MSSSVTFRPICDDDHEFLYRLYASTRQEELAPVPWSDEEKERFLRMQFHAQHTYYQEHYGDSQFDLILVDDQPAGRLYLQRRADEHRIVDIALMPEQRGQGIGSQLMQDILNQAADENKPVRIHVEKNNRAMHLYQRLGFQKIEDKGVYDLMEWQPGNKES